jgi:hypothetical protein
MLDVDKSLLLTRSLTVDLYQRLALAWTTCVGTLALLDCLNEVGTLVDQVLVENSVLAPMRVKRIDVGPLKQTCRPGDATNLQCRFQPPLRWLGVC